MDDSRRTTQYEIHVRGILGDRSLSAFPEMHAQIRAHETVLRGALPDQSALHGVLNRIEALGLELLEVRRAKPEMGTRRIGRGRSREPNAPRTRSDVRND